MKTLDIPYYQVDAFTDELFKGNPAGVCLLPGDWLADELLQNIALENNLSETAFVIRQNGKFGLRWFTPSIEVDLCGHATLAPAHILFTETDYKPTKIDFTTKSGEVSVSRVDGKLVLDFPSRPPEPCEPPADVATVFGCEPQAVLRSRDYLILFENETAVRQLNPNFELMATWDCLGVIATAPGDSVDFVSRFFAPAAGINEDPVTGSAHSTLIPYWAEQLGKQDLHAKQLSNRSGELFCQAKGDRVNIGGKAITYLRGSIQIAL